MSDLRDDLIERVTRELRNTAPGSPQADRRVMDAVRALPRHGRGGLAGAVWWRWLVEPRELRVAPVWGVAAAAVLAAVLLAPWRGGGAPSPPAPPGAGDTVPVQFVLVAPGAASVTLVGDFNDWDVRATPMSAKPARGVWSAEIRLPSDRYRYAFVVDGRRWLPDPTAPLDAGDDFGAPSSVITVGRGGSSL